jgi:hypothetical protein
MEAFMCFRRAEAIGPHVLTPPGGQVDGGREVVISGIDGRMRVPLKF